MAWSLNSCREYEKYARLKERVVAEVEDACKRAIRLQPRYFHGIRKGLGEGPLTTDRDKSKADSSL
jgi:hypothetical protein